MKAREFPAVVLDSIAFLASRAIVLLVLLAIAAIYRQARERAIPADRPCENRFNLFEAVDQNDIPRVKKCLANGISPDVEVEGCTIEEHARSRGRTEILRLIRETRTNSACDDPEIVRDR